MTSAWWVTADVREALAATPDGSVDLVLTSPPFLALRSYLPADHPDKGKEIGSESTPAEFLSTLLALSDEFARVLAPHGSICVELGDTYSGSGGGGGDYSAEGLRSGQPKFDGSGKRVRETRREGYIVNGVEPPVRRILTDAWPLAKSLTFIPQLYGASLAYGRNLLTGEPCRQWRVRNVVAWVRPNPPVGALCVDDQTEALTPDGWRRHEQLEDGDLIAVYDKATDSCRFAPAKFVRWERDAEPMVVIEKRKTSQRLTEDHRCLVRTRKRPEPHVVLAADLTNSHQTMLAAPFDDTGGVEPMSDARAELLGWFITEGSPKYRQALIRQSKSANPQKVARIRDLLIAEGADFTESDYRRSSGTYGGDILTTFHVKGELAAWLNLHHKRLPERYATSWPTTTLRALWRGLVDGDGHRRHDGGTLFFQKQRQVVDAFQIIAVRLGYRCTVTRSDPLDGWQATVGQAEAFESSRWTNVRKWDGECIPREQYTGTVWCPMVETSFWLARRSGRTFITGNSDKFRPATSYITVACQSRTRWFDLDAVREPAQTGDRVMRQTTPTHDPGRRAGARGMTDRMQANNPAGAPPLDWWCVPPGGYDGAHFAVYPPELLVRPIKAMCPLRVCTVCGEPSRRVVGEVSYTRNDSDRVPARLAKSKGKRIAAGVNQHHQDDGANTSVTRHVETLGFTDCGHNSWRNGRVLDPFGGSGTTAMVATGHGRDCLSFDLDSRNSDLAYERVGGLVFRDVPLAELPALLAPRSEVAA